MTDPKGQNDNSASPEQGAEPVVSKPYIMPDDPEPGSAEVLAKELAEAKDKTLRTLAEMENLRQRTRREPTSTRSTSFASPAFPRMIRGRSPRPGPTRRRSARSAQS